LRSLPKGWIWKKLGDISSELQQGFAEGQKNIANGIPHLRMNNITTEFETDLSLLRRVNATPKQLDKYSLRKGDIIINNTNSPNLVGKSAIFNLDDTCVFSNHLARLRLRQGYDPVWVLYYLKFLWHQRYFENNCQRWVNQAAFHIEKIKQIDIPIAPENICNWFSSVVKRYLLIRYKRRQALSFSNQLLESVFIKLFGDPESNDKEWPTKSLHEIIEISKRIVKPGPEHQNMPHIGGENIESYTGRLLNVHTIKEDGIRSANFLFDSNEVLYCKIRPNLRKVSMPGFSGLCSADIYPLIPKNVNRFFLWHLLRTPAFTKYATSIASTRASIPKINREELLRYRAIYPSIAQQELFGNIAQKTEEIIAKQEESSKEISKFMESVLLQTFGGTK
jgi:type I restriction enzyme, S subunit